MGLGLPVRAIVAAQIGLDSTWEHQLHLYEATETVIALHNAQIYFLEKH